MSKCINLNGHKFSVCSPDELKNRSGVYAILCQTHNMCKLIDTGESAKIKKRVKNPDRKKCWNKVGKKLHGKILCAVKYTPYKKRSERRKIEKGIRKNILNGVENLVGYDNLKVVPNPCLSLSHSISLFFLHHIREKHTCRCSLGFKFIKQRQIHSHKDVYIDYFFLTTARYPK